MKIKYPDADEMMVKCEVLKAGLYMRPSCCSEDGVISFSARELSPDANDGFLVATYNPYREECEIIADVLKSVSDEILNLDKVIRDWIENPESLGDDLIDAVYNLTLAYNVKFYSEYCGGID